VSGPEDVLARRLCNDVQIDVTGVFGPVLPSLNARNRISTNPRFSAVTAESICGRFQFALSDQQIVARVMRPTLKQSDNFELVFAEFFQNWHRSVTGRNHKLSAFDPGFSPMDSSNEFGCTAHILLTPPLVWFWPWLLSGTRIRLCLFREQGFIQYQCGFEARFYILVFLFPLYMGNKETRVYERVSPFA
jgi:hypothetical protein